VTPTILMSESAANVKCFLRSALRLATRLVTLQTAGADGKPLLGSTLSADSGAKTRLGFGAS